MIDNNNWKLNENHWFKGCVMFVAANLIVLEKEQSAARLPVRPNMVPENWDTALRKLSGAYSDNTLRAYASDFRIFKLWCLQRGLSFVPAESETLSRFIEFQAKVHKPSTVCRRLDAINRVHKLCGFGVPTDNEDVRLTLRRMQRRHGRRQKQALGLTAQLRDRLIDAASKGLRGLRNRALLAVGYDTRRQRRRPNSILQVLELESMNPTKKFRIFF